MQWFLIIATAMLVVIFAIGLFGDFGSVARKRKSEGECAQACGVLQVESCNGSYAVCGREPTLVLVPIK